MRKSGGSLPASEQRGRCASSFVPVADLDGRKNENNRPAIKLNHRDELGRLCYSNFNLHDFLLAVSGFGPPLWLVLEDVCVCSVYFWRRGVTPNEN